MLLISAKFVRLVEPDDTKVSLTGSSIVHEHSAAVSNLDFSNFEQIKVYSCEFALMLKIDEPMKLVRMNFADLLYGEICVDDCFTNEGHKELVGSELPASILDF